MKKAALRALIQEMRRSMAFEDVHAKSLEAQKRLAASRFFKGAEKIALYASFSNEVLTDELLKTALKHGKEVS
ncbi:MAG: 5-formyltetrahydrofolate cyclo-ligase, partial [Deltaproteobacteria bacterium]